MRETSIKISTPVWSRVESPAGRSDLPQSEHGHRVNKHEGRGEARRGAGASPLLFITVVSATECFPLCTGSSSQ